MFKVFNFIKNFPFCLDIATFFNLELTGSEFTFEFTK